MPLEVVDLSTTNDASKQKIIEDFERKRKARNLAIPTDDAKVRQKLMELGEPRVVFAENAMDRRERLRDFLSRNPEAIPLMADESDAESEESEMEEEFFTYGTEGLLEARRSILDYSIPRAKQRISAQNQEVHVDLVFRKKIRFEWYSHCKTFETKALQFGDDRPLSYCTFSPNSKLLATGSWSGLIKLWSVPGSEHVHSFKGHTDRISGLDFHPLSTRGQSRNALNIVSAASDGSVLLWDFDSDKPIGALEGHAARVSRAQFHPSGRYIGTSSFDATWRLWDAETRQELLLQEGHSRQLYGLAFQGDGSLVATGGMDNIVRVWDLRTGRSIMVLKGHHKHVLSLDWSPNGHHLVTGSEDYTLRIWDIRKATTIYTVPAHKNIVSQVKYFKAGDAFQNDHDAASGYTFTKDGMDVTNDEQNDNASDSVLNSKAALETTESPIANSLANRRIRRQVLNGSFLVSSSYDGTCKIWTDGDFKPLKSLTGLEGKITCSDISGDGKYIATTLYDRTFKLFAPSEVDIDVEAAKDQSNRGM